jgi:hypothetical protein
MITETPEPRGPAILLLLLALVSACLAVPCLAGGWRVLPVLGYSSSSGVQLGGLLTNLHQDAGGAELFILNAWYGTKGALVVEPEIRFFGPGGFWTVGAAYRKRTDSKWYGWGNYGDEDSVALYDMEQQLLYGRYEKPLGGGFLLSAGLEGRHCVAYGFEESVLFDSSPSDERSSSWTAGPEVRLTYSTGGNTVTTLEAGGCWQAGDASYGSADCSASILAAVGGRTSAGLNLELRRHFRSGSTPFPFLPSLGGGDGLRGFAGDRFRGDWSVLANLELRRVLFSFESEEGAELGLGVVLFGDAGQVGDSLGGFAWDGFHLDAGFGLRSYVGEAVLRADIGFSNEGFGINTGFSELF